MAVLANCQKTRNVLPVRHKLTASPHPTPSLSLYQLKLSGVWIEKEVKMAAGLLVQSMAFLFEPTAMVIKFRDAILIANCTLAYSLSSDTFS